MEQGELEKRIQAFRLKYNKTKREKYAWMSTAEKEKMSKIAKKKRAEEKPCKRAERLAKAKKYNEINYPKIKLRLTELRDFWKNVTRLIAEGVLIFVENPPLKSKTIDVSTQVNFYEKNNGGININEQKNQAKTYEVCDDSILSNKDKDANQTALLTVSSNLNFSNTIEKKPPSLQANDEDLSSNLLIDCSSKFKEKAESKGSKTIMYNISPVLIEYDGKVASRKISRDGEAKKSIHIEKNLISTATKFNTSINLNSPSQSLERNSSQTSSIIIDESNYPINFCRKTLVSNIKSSNKKSNEAETVNINSFSANVNHTNNDTFPALLDGANNFFDYLESQNCYTIFEKVCPEEADLSSSSSEKSLMLLS